MKWDGDNEMRWDDRCLMVGWMRWCWNYMLLESVKMTYFWMKGLGSISLDEMMDQNENKIKIILRLQFGPKIWIGPINRSLTCVNDNLGTVENPNHQWSSLFMKFNDQKIINNSLGTRMQITWKLL